MEPVGKALESAGRALVPAGRALEPAGKPGASWEGPNASWEARGQLGGPAERPEGGRRKEREIRAFLVCATGSTIGHHPLRGRCPKANE